MRSASTLLVREEEALHTEDLALQVRPHHPISQILITIQYIYIYIYSSMCQTYIIFYIVRTMYAIEQWFYIVRIITIHYSTKTNGWSLSHLTIPHTILHSNTIYTVGTYI